MAGPARRTQLLPGPVVSRVTSVRADGRDWMAEAQCPIRNHPAAGRGLHHHLRERGRHFTLPSDRGEEGRPPKPSTEGSGTRGHGDKPGCVPSDASTLKLNDPADLLAKKGRHQAPLRIARSRSPDLNGTVARCLRSHRSCPSTLQAQQRPRETTAPILQELAGHRVSGHRSLQHTAQEAPFPGAFHAVQSSCRERCRINSLWLGDLDSNQGHPSQSRKFYR